jgi:hypothetical protein
VFAGISRRCFYEYYNGDVVYGDTITRIREECEVDARQKFELGIIPSKLAGLWMSNYGYGKVDAGQAGLVLLIVINY